LLDQIHKVAELVEEDIDSVLIVAHNPGLENLLKNLTDIKKSDHTSVDNLKEEGFTTAGLALLEFPNTTWSQITSGTGELRDFKTPEILRTEFKSKRHSKL